MKEPSILSKQNHQI